MTYLHLVNVFSWLACLAVFALSFCSFFEDRSNGVYRFRMKRYLLAFVAILLLYLFTAIVLAHSIVSSSLESMAVAEGTVIKNRQIAQYANDHFEVLFPDIWTDQTQACAKAAFSHLIEDHWNMIYERELKKAGGNNSKLDALAAIDPNVLKYVNGATMGGLSDSFWEANLVLGAIWPTGGDIYKIARGLMRLENSEGVVEALPEQAIVDQYHHILKECKSLSPLPWVVVGAPLLTTKPRLYYDFYPVRYLSQNIMIWLVCSILVLVLSICLLRHKGWNEFAFKRKKAARLCVFVLFVSSLWGISLFVNTFVVSGYRLRFEDPPFTATAIKLGLYKLYMQHYLETKLPKEKRAFVLCLYALSDYETREMKAKFLVDQPIFPMSQQEIIDRIAAIQSHDLMPISEKEKYLYESCRKVDLNKL